MSRKKKRRLPQAPGPGARVIGYGRFSQGPEQERSTEQQRKDLDRRAAAEGWQIVGWFEDNSRSGLSVDGRDQFQAMLDRCLADPESIDAVILWDFSRFARNEADFGYFLGMLERLGIAVVSMNEPLPAGPVASIVRSAYAFGAAEESRKISLRVKRGHLAGLRQGFAFGGRPPVGYRAERVAAGTKINGDARYSVRWVIDEAKAPAVRRAFAMYIDGYAITQIHEATHLLGIVPSYTWMFNNPTYIGTLRYGDNEFPGVIEAIIDTGTWDRAQQRRAERTPPRRRQSSYILSGLAFCGHCGRPMNGHNTREYRYYVCIRRFLAPWQACPARFVPADDMEREITAGLLARLSPENVDAIVVELQGQAAAVGPARQLAKEDADIARTERAIVNLWAAVEDGSASARKQLIERERELAELQAKRAELAAGDGEILVAPVIDRTAVLAVLGQLSSGLRVGDVEEKRAVLRRAIERITVKDGNIDVFYRKIVL